MEGRGGFGFECLVAVGVATAAGRTGFFAERFAFGDYSAHNNAKRKLDLSPTPANARNGVRKR